MDVLQVHRHFILYSDARYMAAFPSIAKYEKGFLMLFRRAPDHRWLTGASHVDDACKASLQSNLYHWDPRSQLIAMELDHELNATADPVGLSVDGQAADQDASLLTLPDGRILLSSFSWYPMPPAFADLAKDSDMRVFGGPDSTGCMYLPWGSYTRIRDGSGEFSPRSDLPPLANAPDIVPGLRTSHGGGARGQAVVSNSEILLPTYGLSPSTGNKHASHFYRSCDGGTTFSYGGLIASDPSVDLYEPSLTLAKDGTLIAWHRTSDPDDRVASCRSSDGGATWSPLQFHDCQGHPPHGLVLRSGHIFLTYGYRHAPFGVRGRILNPHGSNVDSAEEIIIRDDGCHGEIVALQIHQ